MKVYVVSLLLEGTIVLQEVKADGGEAAQLVNDLNEANFGSVDCRSYDLETGDIEQLAYTS